MDAWKAVLRALLGSWPSQVSAWGREALVAYVEELEARHVHPEEALVAIRACSASQTFPPSAPELAALARRDPTAPAFDDVLTAIYGRGGVLLVAPPIVFDSRERAALHDEACFAKAREIHPMVFGFVDHVGLAWLRTRDVAGEFGFSHRRELMVAWDQWTARDAESRLFALAAGRGPGRLSRVDGLRAIGAGDDEG
jgi:hypothetical protein